MRAGRHEIHEPVSAVAAAVQVSGPADAAGIASLVRAVAAVGQRPDGSALQVLGGVAELAARSVPGGCGASATLWRDHEVAAAAASHPDLAALVEVQQAVGDGPCLAALAWGEPVDIPDTAQDRRWPRYTDLALGHGVRCVSTLPFPVAGGASVTLTVCGLRAGVLDGGAKRLGVLLGNLAAASLENVERVDALRRTAAQLEQALASRSVIEQAKGVLMHALGCDADTAFGRLRQVSQQSNRKLADVARELVEGQAAGKR